MKDVARAAGVSPMTVSRAFKTDSSIGLETRQRILKTARDLGYIFDSTASNLRSKKTGFVAVTIPSLNNANFADTVTAMTVELAKHDLQTLLGYTNYDIEEEERLVEHLLRRKPDAIVLTGGAHTQNTRRLLAQSNIPVVEIWDMPHEPLAHVIGFSNARAVGDMVGHLVAQGYKELAFLGGGSPGDTRGEDRLRGFSQAMEAHGLAPAGIVPIGPAPNSMQSSVQAMARLLETCPKADVVVCVSDLTAFAALSECQRRGVSVPSDIAIAGFGNFDISQICCPEISTIDAQSGEIGRQTAQLLARILRDPSQIDESVTIEINTHLLPRGSTQKDT